MPRFALHEWFDIGSAPKSQHRAIVGLTATSQPIVQDKFGARIPLEGGVKVTSSLQKSGCLGHLVDLHSGITLCNYSR